MCNLYFHFENTVIIKNELQGNQMPSSSLSNGRL
jgi:hypothetical protein